MQNYNTDVNTNNKNVNNNIIIWIVNNLLTISFNFKLIKTVNIIAKFKCNNTNPPTILLGIYILIKQ